jgi:signal transduction histidine kinase
LEIKDNGVGISADYKEGKGMTQISERVASLGGELEVLNKKDAGLEFKIGILMRV